MGHLHGLGQVVANRTRRVCNRCNRQHPLSRPTWQSKCSGMLVSTFTLRPHGEPIMVRPAGPCAVRAGTHGGGAARQSVLQTTHGRGTSRDEQGWGAWTGVGVSVARGKPPPVRRSRSSSQNAPPTHACRSISIAASSRSRHCGAVNPAVWARPCGACRAAARARGVQLDMVTPGSTDRVCSGRGRR